MLWYLDMQIMLLNACFIYRNIWCEFGRSRRLNFKFATK